MMNIQMSNNVIISDDKVIIIGKELPHIPSRRSSHNSTIINDKVFINGKMKNGKEH